MGIGYFERAQLRGNSGDEEFTCPIEVSIGRHFIIFAVALYKLAVTICVVWGDRDDVCRRQ